MGHAVLGSMFQSVGSGDVGPTLERPQFTKPLIRYPEPSTRTYRSIFGDFSLPRYRYGKASSQKALAIPFDEQVGLPANRFSLLLESWVSQLSTSETFRDTTYSWWGGCEQDWKFLWWGDSVLSCIGHAKE